MVISLEVEFDKLGRACVRHCGCVFTLNWQQPHNISVFTFFTLAVTFTFYVPQNQLTWTLLLEGPILTTLVGPEFRVYLTNNLLALCRV